MDTLAPASHSNQSSQTEHPSYIVSLWATIFSALRWISLFQILRTLIPLLLRGKRSYIFVENWVVANTGLAILSVALYAPFVAGIDWLAILITIYGAIRVFETLVYNINVMLFDEYRTIEAGGRYRLRGYRRLVILLLHNYIEVVFWFAFFYMSFSYHFRADGLPLDTALGAVYASLQVTSGIGAVVPRTEFGAELAIAHSAAGITMTIIVLSRFLSLLRPSKSMDETDNTD